MAPKIIDIAFYLSYVFIDFKDKLLLKIYFYMGKMFP